jgi:hypothetical protein
LEKSFVSIIRKTKSNNYARGIMPYGYVGRDAFIIGGQTGKNNPIQAEPDPHEFGLIAGSW